MMLLNKNKWVNWILTAMLIMEEIDEIDDNINRNVNFHRL